MEKISQKETYLGSLETPLTILSFRLLVMRNKLICAMNMG